MQYYSYHIYPGIGLVRYNTTINWLLSGQDQLQ